MLLLAIVGFALTPTTGSFAADLGYRDFPYWDANQVRTPTADKPESKLWFQDGSWWGLLYSGATQATSIHRLDLATQTWQDTGTVVDTRPAARGDALWDGESLYVVSGTTVVSEFGSPPTPADVSAGSAELRRYRYDPLTRRHSLDPGFPVTVREGSTESITLAKDSTGQLWITYTVVAPDNTSNVYVNHSTGSDTVWGTPFVMPTNGASIHYDDISTIGSFQGDKVGVMWSNQLTRRFYFAVHSDGSPDDSWQSEVAYGGGVGGCSTGCANDHINLKQLTTDGSGRVFAAIKTANRNVGQPFVALLVRDRQGAWNSHTFGAVEDLHTRPMVMIDEQHREVFLFAVSPEAGGAIYYKKSSIDNISFPPGLGTPFVENSLDTDINNPTSTKQNLTSATGLVLLASANSNAYYVHHYMGLADEPGPDYPRPAVAARVRATLLPAFEPCTSPDSDHSPPLDSGSCSSARQTSSHATVPNDDSTHASGSATYAVRLDDPQTIVDESDVNLAVSFSDVHSTVDGSDYVGELEAQLDLRATDRLNGPSEAESGTIEDFALYFPLSCTPTPLDPSLGSDCQTNTTANAVMPGLVTGGKRAVWELGQIKLFDAGVDGLGSTQGDNTLFAVQGIFVP